MLNDQFFVLVPRVKLLTSELDEDLLGSSERSEERLREQAARELLQEISKLVDLDKVVLLPGFPESFSLPLSRARDRKSGDVLHFVGEIPPRSGGR
jgi:hypothetical protein